MKTLLPLALLAVAAGSAGLTTGCGTVADTAFSARSRSPGPHVFGGVRYDWKMANGGLCCVMSAFEPCFLIDLPLSAALDVALLPVTVPISIWRPRPKTAAEATTP